MGVAKRMASVQTVTETCLATLNRASFTQVMRRAQRKKFAEQVGFLRKFPFYKDFSQIKLQKLYYLLEKRKLIKNSVIFRQGDSIDGIYFIEDGELLYQASQEVYKSEVPASNWINPKLLNNNLNKTIDSRTVAEFSLNEIVGFEEVMHQKVLEIEKQRWINDKANQSLINRDKIIEKLFNDPTTSYRNFTCVVKSLHATVYFLKLEDFHHFYKFIPIDQVTRGVKQRLELLKNQMRTIRKVKKADYDRIVNQIENVETLL